MEYDVVVIGGGVVGTFAALAASRSGEFTAVIDGNGIMGGAASRSAGVVTVQLDDERDVLLVRRSIELLTSVSRRALIRTGFLQIGREDLLEDSIRSMSSAGIAYEVLDAGEVRERWPGIEIGEEELAVYTSEDLSVEPGVLASECRSFLASQGVTMYNEPVRSFRVHDSEVISAVLNGGVEVGGSEFILSAGPWNRSILRGLGVELDTKVIICYAYRFETGVELTIPSFSDEVLHSYWRRWGTELIGGGYHAELADEPDLMPRAPPQEFVEGSRALLMSRVSMAIPSYSGHTSGPCEITPDWRPYLGRLDRIRNFTLCGGLRGYGLMRGPALGSMTYDLLKSGNIGADLDDYDPERLIR
ncbi:MAG: FAD-binding oxidoreductase [Aigarchaeota archaeon]|nr:FAD-binding oxidoreductase [Aigarchaeota archaeon]MDW8093174.1 FAD-binding oxidoreductase [Nitrososphaerota archaeon]